MGTLSLNDATDMDSINEQIPVVADPHQQGDEGGSHQDGAFDACRNPSSAPASGLAGTDNIV